MEWYNVWEGKRKLSYEETRDIIISYWNFNFPEKSIKKLSQKSIRYFDELTSMNDCWDLRVEPYIEMFGIRI